MTTNHALTQSKRTPHSAQKSSTMQPRIAFCHRVVALVAATLLGALNHIHLSQGFSVVRPSAAPISAVLSWHHPSPQTSSLFVSLCDDETVQGTHDDNHDNDNDNDEEEILRQTSKEQLVNLCQQFQLSTKGTKLDLFQRLRYHAAQSAEAEKKRLEARSRRVEEGGEDDREKYELLDGEMEEETDDDDEVFVYVALDDPALADFQRQTQENSDDGPESRTGTRQSSMSNNNSSSTLSFPPVPVTRASLTAPPPPDVPPNENGERVVTVYSTSDQNDLTGVAAAQPGSVADPMTGSVGTPQDAPWNLDQGGKNNKKTASSAEWEAAKEEIIELVQSLLASSGAPGFQNDDDEDDDNDDDGKENVPMYESMGLVRNRKILRDRNAYTSPEGFVGFDPAQVPADVLPQASTSLCMGQGQVLQDVVREFELRAIGYDGPAGDNKERGGGHYRQVSLVRSFLEGYRRAEVRRMARETTTMLLDMLVSEGIEGLDVTLASMARGSKGSTEAAGELNDSLLEYLNDAIRQQEKKTAQVLDSVKKMAELESTVALNHDNVNSPEDELDKLWTASVDKEGSIQTFDPKDPKSKKALEAEYSKSLTQEEENSKAIILPKSAPEKLLLLLKLLRERVKVEAAFSNDEKSRNLRVLAYCLKMPNDDLRKELITKEFGASLDRLDSFAELVQSSIVYGESTSHQLQPSKASNRLNIPLLNRILALTNEINNQQSWKASGGKAKGVQ